MTHVPAAAVDSILKNIPDQRHRSMIAQIINGQITHEVRCHSKDLYGKDEKGKKVVEREGCKGRVIAYIYADGSVREFADENKMMWLRASRDRLDGFKGFECWCGADTRMSDQEKGTLQYNGQPPSKSDLETIWSKIKNKPSDYPEVAGSQNVDGFEIRKVA